jgi:hypothetical protein
MLALYVIYDIISLTFGQKGDNMDKNKHIEFWKETSDKDYITMLNLYDTKDYHWALFIGHLVI